MQNSDHSSAAMTADCYAHGAVGTTDGRKPSNRNELTVSGPPR